MKHDKTRKIFIVCRRGGYFCILLLFLPICCALKNPIETARISQYNITISGNTLKNILVSVPRDKKVQEQISSILGAIDNKIESNEKINNNLVA